MESGRDVLGPYRLLRRLARGGMGEVWEAQRGDGDGERLAVKMLPLDETSPGTLRRFLDEARLGASLFHPNLVRTLEVVQQGDRVGIVMELLDGLSLAELCRPERLAPLGWAVSVACDVLCGLEYLHGARADDGRPMNLVHRDLKPSNLLVTRAGVTKIIDFGIASLEGSERTLTRTGVMRGSLPYCSPEHARQEPLDGRSDLFSFGAVLYELLSGQRCFAQSTEAAVLTAVLFSPTPGVRQHQASVPPQLEALVAQLLEKDPRARPASARETRERLEALFPEGERFTRAQVGEWVEHAKSRRPLSAETADSLSPLGERAGMRGNPAVAAPRRRWPWVAAAATTAALAVVATAVARSDAPQPAPPNAAPPSAQLAVSPEPNPKTEPATASPEPAEPQPEAAPKREAAPRPARAKGPRAVAAAEKGRGWLTVGTPSGWVQVRVGDRELGPTPLFRRELPAGPQTVTVTRPDGARKVMQVMIEPDKERKLSVEW